MQFTIAVCVSELFLLLISMAIQTQIEKKYQNALERLHLFPTSRAYIAASSGLMISAFLLFPGNPAWDWSLTRTPNIIFIYINILLLSSAIFLDRHKYLRRITYTSPARRAVVLTILPLALFSLIGLLYVNTPLYLQSILREHGLAEPFTLFLYMMAVIIGTEHFKALREKGLSYRPYKLLAILYTVLMFEECDWLGLFGAIFGRINGAYLGSIHDIANVMYKNQQNSAIGIFVASAAIVLLIMLWKKKYLTADFLKRELAAPSTILIYLWFIMNVTAGVYDINGNLLYEFRNNVCAFPEEALELAGALFLFIASILKYCRDIRPKSA